MDMISLIILLLYCLSAGRAENVRLDDPSGEGDLTHLLLDDQTGRIFAAGRNSLHQLNSNLKVERLVRTGPQEDSVQCSARGSCQLGAEKSPTDNHNKALVLEPEERILIVCGSLFQGVCERYSADDISHKLPTIAVPVVANDADSSSVVFIGPGLPDARSQRVLYAASEHTQLGPYRSQEEVPAISSRNLHSHDIVRARRFVQARIKIASQSLENFRVHYVTGFYHENYAYFMTVQPNNVDNADEGFVSKLVRVCANDPSYESYMEITLSCQSKGLKYNLLQSAQLIKPGSQLAQQMKFVQTNKIILGAFAASEGVSNTPKSSSGLCMFNMKDAEEVFERNAQLCFSGARTGRGLGFIAGANLPCPKDPRVISDLCGEHLLIEGTLPLVSEALIVYADQLIITVTAATTPQNTVILAGTRNGTVKKILVKSRYVGVEYSSVQLNLPRGADPVARSLLIDAKQQSAFILTKNHVSKIPLTNCETHSTCAQCLESQDPFCGWCSLEKRCSPRESCSRLASVNERDNSPSRWLPFNAHQCIDLLSLSPDHLPISHPATVVRLKIPELPHLQEESYSCVFGEAPPVPANRTKEGLICLFSGKHSKPKITTNQDHMTVEVAVRSTETKQDFVSRPIFLYDCSVHKRCSTCATSKWNCSWCPSDSSCIDKSESCKSTRINHQDKRAKAVERSNCPEVRAEDRTSLLIPNMISKALQLKVNNMPTLIKNAILECLVEVEGRTMRTPAVLNGNNKIMCDEAVFYYDSDVDEMAASLSVVWNWSNIIDTVNVTIYKCRLKGPDCGICLTRSPEYGCIWTNDECQFDALRDKNKIQNQTCPSPSIDSIFPVSGPVDGGTRITIIGRELGMKIEDVKDAIRVADVPCIPVEYEVSRRIVCLTSSVPHNGPRSGPVVLSLPNRPSQTSYQKFYFLNATVFDMAPRLGPQSGGTRVTITGNQLDIGSQVQVIIGDLLCQIEDGSITSSQLVCLTSPAPSSKYLARGVILKLDESTRNLDADFQYMSNPVLNDIEPLVTFISGGTQLVFYGDYFNVVQSTQLLVKLKGQDPVINQTVCEVQSARSVICPAPSIKKFLEKDLEVVKREVQNQNLQFEASLRMDGWTSQTMVLTYLADPKIYAFVETEGVKIIHDLEEIAIEGERLNEAASDQDYSITIQSEICNITSISSSKILCVPTEVTSPTSAKLLVSVRVGNLVFHPGYLIYSLPIEAKPSPPTDSVTGIAVGAGVLLIVCLLVLILYRRKTSQAEREYKRIQLQMDTLENHVRMECKQAFTELQTDISDIALDLQVSGIPYWDHRMYIMKIFFPLSHNHPVLHDIRSCRNNRCTGFESTMMQFEQLLTNKQFLLNFICALESQKTFGIRDRANVASLLMIVFLDKLDYITEIFRELIMDLMERSVASKHPQLMLRRAESVVEKMMSNWIALAMLEYVREHVGTSMFVLFQAVKCQVEKGPVDCLTHDARYSLSEDRLLREQVHYQPIQIHLHQDDLDEKIQCRVLDCDSISQVKSKLLDALYKTTPTSTRPSLYEIDLEWHNSQHGRIILQDEDATSEFGDGWRRINTLRHYGILESAVMTLVLKSCQDGFYPGGCEISPYSMTTPGLARDYSGKVWHLTKGNEGQLTSSRTRNNNYNTVPEIFLTRLLSTKGTLQKYIDDLFRTILTVTDDLPVPVKWLFDLYDDYGREMGVTDPEVIHAWKSNSLPLRFWVNLIKNPEFLFDVQKTPTVDACLSVIAQTFMDSCTIKEHLRLNKDSPSNKLLFAKEIPQIRAMVQSYYETIQELPAVDNHQLLSSMATLSKNYGFQLNIVNGLKELFSYAVKYNVEIMEKLEEDPVCQQLRLNSQFEVLCRSGNYFTLPMNNCL